MTKNVVIIGGGPAGYTAAIYAARAGLSPILLEGPQPGGQLMITTEVENYPGFPSGGVNGPELMQRFRQQALDFGTEIIPAVVTEVDFSRELGPHLYLYASNGLIYHAHSVILATGAKAKLTGLKGEDTFWGRGISACATCDGFFFRGKRVAVIGGGDTACEEALFLANLCEKVWLIHRRPEFRASKIMQERVRNHPKIECVMDVNMERFFSYGQNDVLQGVMFYPNSDPADNQFIDVEGAFVAIGHEPATSFLGQQVALNSSGYIITRPHSTEVIAPAEHPSPLGQVIKGVFAAGDCADWVYRQAVTAAGEGCKAAIEAERYLAECNPEGLDA
jgi:thioredoxin reductase (NADPH)